MYSKNHIERILRINGLSTEASDEDIKSVLLYANCQNADDAIAALRDGSIDGKQDICGLQQSGAKCNVLLADKRLEPETIKELLGIDVELNFADIEHARIRRKSVSFLQVAGITLLSILFAASTLLGVMWYYQIGVFHPLF